MTKTANGVLDHNQLVIILFSGGIKMKVKMTTLHAWVNIAVLLAALNSFAFQDNSHIRLTDNAVDFYTAAANNSSSCVDPAKLKAALDIGATAEDAYPRYQFHFDPWLTMTTSSCTASQWAFNTGKCYGQLSSWPFGLENTHKWSDATSGQAILTLSQMVTFIWATFCIWWKIWLPPHMFVTMDIPETQTLLKQLSRMKVWITEWFPPAVFLVC